MTELVSILLATKNRAALLPRAIRSIQVQTWTDIEILVLDDGSSDTTPEILEHLSRLDHRIKTFRNENSSGLAAGLNTLIAASKGDWLARMDDDDLSYPDRIEQQLAFIQKNQLDVCGTWYRRVSRFGRSVLRPAITHDAIMAELLFQPPLLHPSVMMRRALIDKFGGYREDAPHAEDYELWTRLARHGRFGNVPKVLMDYTLSPNQVSRTYNAQQVQTAQKIRAHYLQALKIAHTKDQLDTHTHMRDPIPIEDIETLKSADHWLQILKQEFVPQASSVFRQQWFMMAVRAAGIGPETYKTWRRSPLAQHASLSKHSMLWLLCQSRLHYKSKAYQFLEPLADG